MNTLFQDQNFAAKRYSIDKNVYPHRNNSNKNAVRGDISTPGFCCFALRKESFLNCSHNKYLCQRFLICQYNSEFHFL